MYIIYEKDASIQKEKISGLLIRILTWAATVSFAFFTDHREMSGTVILATFPAKKNDMFKI